MNYYSVIKGLTSRCYIQSVMIKGMSNIRDADGIEASVALLLVQSLILRIDYSFVCASQISCQKHVLFHLGILARIIKLIVRG